MSTELGQLETITLEIEQIEQNLIELLHQTAQVSNEFQNLGNQIQNFSSSFASKTTSFTREVGKEIKRYGKSTKDKKTKAYGELIETGADFAGSVVGGIIEVGGEVVKGIGSLIADYKTNKAKRQILQKKQELARAKFSFVKKQHKNITINLNKIEKIYDAANININLDNPLLKARAKMLNEVFRAYTKLRYMDYVLNYIISEYSAWLNGDQNGEIKEPKFRHAASEIIETISASKQTIYLILSKKDMEIRLDQSLIFLNPYIYQKVCSCDFKSSPIHLHPKDRYGNPGFASKCGIFKEDINLPIMNLLQENPYYQERVELTNSIPIPKYPHTNLLDVAVDLLLIITTLYYLYWSYNAFTGWSYLGMLSLGILGAYNLFAGLFNAPYRSKMKKYNKSIANFEREVNRMGSKHSL